MDGSVFEAVELDVQAEAASASLPLHVSAAIAPRPASTLKERLAHPLSVGLAAVAHLAVLVAMLPVEAEVLGDGGAALESVAVAIVERVPVVSPPSAGSQFAPLEQIPDEPQQEVAPVEQVDKVVVDPPKPPDKLPEMLPDEAPPADAVPVAVKPPDPEPPKELEPEAARKEAVQQQVAAAATAPEMVVAVAAVEASAGVVKAYESALSRVIASRPPRPRGLKGRLVVELVIGEDGKPETTTVIEPSGRRALDEAVLAALRRLQFPVPPPEMTLRQRTFHQAFVYN